MDEFGGLNDVSNVTDNSVPSNYTPPDNEKSWFKKAGATIIDSFGEGFSYNEFLFMCKNHNITLKIISNVVIWQFICCD